MPEGPSIIILKELTRHFNGKKIIGASGVAKVDHDLLIGQNVRLKTWGKHFLICTKKLNLRVHLLLFGSYSVDEKRRAKPKLVLEFSNGTLYFYACSVVELSESLNEIYDWEADVMSDKFNVAKARKKLKETPDTLVCDALLDQQIFSGVGNIIKSEVLFRVYLHPESKLGKIPTRTLTKMIKETTVYAYDFLKWKKAGVLKKNWEAYAKKKCPRCDIPLIKKNTGKTRRRSFFCNNCQSKFV